MGRKFTDNALTTLAVAVAAVDTTLTVTAGKGDNFPAVTGKGAAGSAIDYFVITLEDAAGNREKIKVEQRAAGSDALGSAGYPLVRGYDGTVARAWSVGDSVDLRVDLSFLRDTDDKVSASALGRAFGAKGSTTNGLNFGYYGGALSVDGVLSSIADGVVVLTANQTNYVERDDAGTVTANIVGFSATKIPLYEIVTDAAAITAITDRRVPNLPPHGMVTKDVSAGGVITLSAQEARAPVIQFTGVLPNDTAVEFPNVKRAWTVVNDTTGFFTLKCRITGQTGAEFYQGRATPCVCNGTDIKKVGEDVPPGTIMDYAADAIDAGYALPCDGANFVRATNSALFTKIGTTWGAGDGLTTAAAPDLRRRGTVGKGGTGTATLGNAVGNVGGEEAHALTGAETGPHTHGVTDPGHSHTQFLVNGVSGLSLQPSSVNINLNGPTSGDVTGISIQSGGSGTPHNNLPPLAVVTKMIRL